MEIVMDIAGLGIIIYSPSSALHIAEGEDYLEAHFWDPADVAEHGMAGGITAFATSSPGTYRLEILEGYPPKDWTYDSSLRLGLRCDGVAVFKDLYELMGWTAEYSRNQAVEMPDGNYHVTVCTQPAREWDHRRRPDDRHLLPAARRVPRAEVDRRAHTLRVGAVHNRSGVAANCAHRLNACPLKATVPGGASPPQPRVRRQGSRRPARQVVGGG